LAGTEHARALDFSGGPLLARRSVLYAAEMNRGLCHSPSGRTQRGQRAFVRSGRWTRSLVGALSLACVASLTTGCLVDEPPEFEDPERTAPIMFLQSAVPTYGQVLVLQRNSPGVPFTIRVQSEDLKKSLWLHVWKNFGLNGEARIDSQENPPGTFKEPREITFILEPNLLTPGCVPITLILQHEDNFDQRTLKPLDFSLATMAVWYAVVDVDPADVSFADCPQPTTKTPTTESSREQEGQGPN
jgi:hypothetical protein